MAERQKRRTRKRAERQSMAPPAILHRPALENQLPVYEILQEETVDKVLDFSLRILEDIGIEFRHPDAPNVWKNAGAKVDGARIYIPRDLLLKFIESIPSKIKLHARNAERSVLVGGNHTVFSGTYGSPNVLDFDNQRRFSTLEDLKNFTKLAHVAPTINVNGGVLVEPLDIDVPKRHLHFLRTALTLSDKPVMGAVTSQTAANDTIKMLQIVFGEEFVDNNTVVAALVNCNSPLVWDETMLNALTIYAKANQSVICTPFIMAGASSPVSTIGSCAQLIAEALAGMAYAQIIRSGSPMIFGCCTHTISMRSGAPLCGTPEAVQMNIIVGQVVRKLGLPWRASGMWSTAKTPDMQAGFETIMSIFPCLLAQANWIIHAVGYVEGGLAMSYSKFVHDVEQIGIFYDVFKAPKMDDLDEVFETIREVGPGAHFLGAAHTRKNMFYIPELANADSFEQWRDEGARDANQVGLDKAKKILDEYEPPAIDDNVNGTLAEFIEKREAEL